MIGITSWYLVSYMYEWIYSCIKLGSVVVEEEEEEEEEVGPAQTEAHMGGTSEEEIMNMDQGEDDKNMETGSHVNGS